MISISSTETPPKEQPISPQMARHADLAREDERARIAREIHDELGGNLTAIKMALAMLTRNLPTEPTLAENAAYLDSLVDRTIESMHRLATNLRPSVLDFGLVAAIEWQLREFRKQTNIDCSLDAEDETAIVPAELATTLFRILQESLTNISKHAQASQVCVTLGGSKRTVQLRVADNGVGCSDPIPDMSNRQALGIRGMIERANSIGGKLTVSRNVGGGTVISVKAPRAGR
ncbi:MAG: sensor histidine kinase [Pseudomonadota bacterium]